MERNEAKEYLYDIADKFGTTAMEYLTSRDAEKMWEAVDVLYAAQPNLQPTCNHLATDLISRKEAIDGIEELAEVANENWEYGEEAGLMKAKAELMELPAAQPEREKGEWKHSDNKLVPFYCSRCSGRFDYEWKFCPNCGADMREETT